MMTKLICKGITRKILEAPPLQILLVISYTEQTLWIEISLHWQSYTIHKWGLSFHDYVIPSWLNAHQGDQHKSNVQLYFASFYMKNTSIKVCSKHITLNLKCSTKYHIPTNVDTDFHSWHTLSPLRALTSKVNVVSGLSPDSLVMTMFVVEPFTSFTLL